MDVSGYFIPLTVQAGTCPRTEVLLDARPYKTLGNQSGGGAHSRMTETVEAVKNVLAHRGWDKRARCRCRKVAEEWCRKTRQRDFFKAKSARPGEKLL